MRYPPLSACIKRPLQAALMALHIDPPYMLPVLSSFGCLLTSARSGSAKKLQMTSATPK